MIIDFEHHYVPRALAESVGIGSGARLIRQSGTISATYHELLYDLDEQARDMEKVGVDAAILSSHLGWDADLDLCKSLNDELAKVGQRYAGIFFGFAHSPVVEGPAAVDELRRAILDLGLRGITITSQVHGALLDDERLFPLWQLASEKDVPIFVHPSLIPRGFDSASDHEMPRVISREFDLALAVLRIIRAGILDEFPDVKLVFSHFGGGITAIKERLDSYYYMLKPKSQQAFDHYFKKLYFNTAGFQGGQIALETGCKAIGSDRLVFGTDYPQDFSGIAHDTGEEGNLKPKLEGPSGIAGYIERIRKLRLPADEIEMILGGNAARLLKL